MSAFAYLEEHCTATPEGRMTRYRGSRVLDQLPPGRKTGAENSQTLELKEPVTIYKGAVNPKAVSLPEGTKVWRWITPLEGRR